MSGGSYDYAFQKINDFAEALEGERQIDDCRPWPDDIDAENRALRKAFAAHLRLVSDAMKAIEWVDSSDCSPPHDVEAIRAVLDPDVQKVRRAGIAAVRFWRDIGTPIEDMHPFMEELRRVLGMSSCPDDR